jgi:membrane fusion protein, multidrug efflux system
MKKLLLLLVVLAAVAAGLVVAHREMRKERDREADSEKPVAAPLRVQAGTNGENVIKLDTATQQRIALQTAPLVAARLEREVKAYGRVLEPAPLAAVLSEISAAQAAVAASQSEFARVKKLFEQGQSASARSLETAQALLTRDQVTLEAARDKLVLGWGKAMAAQADLPAFARALVTQENLLVRLELPAGEALKEAPAVARLVPLAQDAQPLEATFFGWPTVMDPQSQGQGFLFLVKGNPLRLAPGGAVLGWIKAGGEPLAGVVVPRPAIVRLLGQAWVYVQTGGDLFLRRPVTLEHPVESGWLVTAGLQPGERLVTTGAQVLLSEELKSQIKLVD